LRLRAIASVGVVLCAAMTSLSIYLGIAEHVYSPPQRIYTQTYVDPQGKRQEICLTVRGGNTTTTSPHHDDKAVSCKTAVGGS
jgi:hypothetical protein